MVSDEWIVERTAIVEHFVLNGNAEYENELAILRELARLRAQGKDVARLVEAVKDSHCPKCGGVGWVWGYELDDPDNDTATDTMTRYTCDWCKKLKAALAPFGKEKV